MPEWLPDNLAELVLFRPLRIVLLIIAAFVLRRVLRRLINRSVRRAIDKPLSARNEMTQKLINVTTPSAERRKQRLSALGSLAQSTVTLVIFGVLILMILAELGYNITTILAGTTVIAVTVAFGLQSVVKDLFSGVFMLVEDQLGVGDYVDMDMASGVVQAIGLRVTELRGEDGTVWYVRNGEVLRVGNFSQGGPGRAAGRSRTCPELRHDLRAAYSACVASSVIVVPVIALETGQFFLASSAAASNCSAVMPGTTPITDSLMPVMPSPGWKVTSARVSSEVGGLPPWARTFDECHVEARGMRSGDQLLGAGVALRLLGAPPPADLEAAEAGRNELHLSLAIQQGSLPVGFRGPNCSHE